MLRMVAFAIALLVGPATDCWAGISSCSQVPDLSAARHRWAALRQSHGDTGEKAKNCPAYFDHFYEAVTARHAVAVCSRGADHRRDLDLLDAEINSFNNLIAAQCSSDAS